MGLKRLLTSVNTESSSAWFDWRQTSASEQLAAVVFPGVTQRNRNPIVWHTPFNCFLFVFYTSDQVCEAQANMWGVCASYPETKVQHSVLLVDALPGLDHLRKEGFDYVQMSWFQEVVLRPSAEHLEGPPESSAHLLLAEELYFSTEAPLGPGRHAVVDGVWGALLQAVHSHRLPWGDTEQQVSNDLG